MTIDRKKTIKAACCGAMLYVIACSIVSWIFAPFISKALQPGSSLENGPTMILNVVIGCIILWLFANRQKRREKLFIPDESALSAVFEKNRSISIKDFVLIVLFMFFLQLVSEQLLKLMELGLNCIGLTAMSMESEIESLGNSWITLLYGIIIGPIAEELVYRGYLMKGLKPCGRIFAIVVSSIMFSIMHANLYQLIFPLMIGLMLGYVAMEYSIYVTMILHIINNGSSFGLAKVAAASQTAYNVIYYGLCAAGTITAVYLFIKHKDYVRKYLASNRAEKGTVRYLFNIWFIIFILFHIGLGAVVAAYMG